MALAPKAKKKIKKGEYDYDVDAPKAATPVPDVAAQ